jgi:hypothetical protein
MSNCEGGKKPLKQRQRQAEEMKEEELGCQAERKTGGLKS